MECKKQSFQGLSLTYEVDQVIIKNRDELMDLANKVQNFLSLLKQIQNVKKYNKPEAITEKLLKTKKKVYTPRSHNLEFN